MKTALLACLALLACALMFTACGSGDEPQTSNGATDGNTTEDSTMDGTTDGATDGATEPETEAHVHSFSEWITVKESTTTEKGLTQRYCLECNYTESKSLDLHVHSFGEWTVIKEANSSGRGEQERVCVCGEKDSGTSSLHLAYIVNDDGITCTIIGMGTCTDTELYIGDSIDGYKVTAIGANAFAYCTTLTHVEIPRTVTVINRCAFFGCSNLLKAVLSEGLYTIEEAVFANCFSLKEIKLPDSLQNIKRFSFQQCEALVSVEIPEGITTLGDSTFTRCSSLESVTLPSTLSEIYYGVFNDCPKLVDIYYNGTCMQWKNLLTLEYGGVTTPFVWVGTSDVHCKDGISHEGIS